jgi:hypothetical protein
LCTICNPINSHNSSKEIELKDFIKTNYKGIILTNDRNIIKPYEIDIYLPELKIGFELNGLYWHSDKYKKKNYHRVKQQLYEKNGIKLYNIYEDDWIYKEDIVKSNILKLFNKIEFEKNVKVSINDDEEIDSFLIENNIFKKINNKCQFMCIYDNFKTLICVISYSMIKNYIEIFDICEKKNIKVDNVLKIICNFFENDKIFLHTKRDWDIFNLNTKIGEVDPESYFIIRDQRHNIESTFKYKIYDSGEIIYQLK